MAEEKIEMFTLKIFDADQTLFANALKLVKRGTAELRRDEQFFSLHSSFVHFSLQTLVDFLRSQGQLRHTKVVVEHQKTDRQPI